MPWAGISILSRRSWLWSGDRSGSRRASVIIARTATSVAPSRAPGPCRPLPIVGRRRGRVVVTPWRRCRRQRRIVVAPRRRCWRSTHRGRRSTSAPVFAPAAAARIVSFRWSVWWHPGAKKEVITTCKISDNFKGNWTINYSFKFNLILKFIGHFLFLEQTRVPRVFNII